jgi:hypothetical protein
MASLSSERYVALPVGIPPQIVAVPAVAADLTATTSVMWQITVANTTASAITFLVKDKQATPRTILPTVSIAGNTTYIVSWPEGQYCDGGINWVASGAGLEASVVGSRKSA